MRILILFYFAFFCFASAPGIATDNTDAQLDKFENKLFQHTYDKDSVDTRLDRIEKLVFGDKKTGNTDERIATLLQAVPVQDNSANEQTANSTNSSHSADANSSSEKRKTSKEKTAPDMVSETAKADDSDNADKEVEVGSYPAVSAMETKLLGKDYASEPIKDRLTRLENKVLGHVSSSNDLSERVDKLKEATGIDVARKPGSMSDWLEDDQDEMLGSTPLSTGRSPNNFGGSGNYGFGSGDAYKDMQDPYSIPMPTARHPMGSPYFPDESTRSKSPVYVKNLGLSQQVSALEHEVFGKAYSHDPLPARLNRLEAAVFPQQKPSVDKPLPDRVKVLLAKVPISQDTLQTVAPTDSLDNTFDSNSIAQHSQKLNKIINQMSNMMSGGMASGFPLTNSGNYVLDPQTGMYLDPQTGAMIDPNTGTVYSGKGLSSPLNGMNSYSNSYSNSFSPFGFGSPYGMGGMGGFGPGFGMGPGFGFGGGGMGMGFGFR